jgi:F-type H+-transporting ATPase subunit delta
MISSSIFARYARALADVTLAAGEDAAVRRELETYREIFRKVPALLDALDSPAIPRDAKERVVSGLLARYPVSRTTGNFLRILQDHHRIRYFEEIYHSYVRTVNERKGIVAARVTSAVPLSDKETALLHDTLCRSTGNQVTLEACTDPAILAGIVVQIGSTVYDGSVRTQLDQMRRRLAHE